MAKPWLFEELIYEKHDNWGAYWIAMHKIMYNDLVLMHFTRLYAGIRWFSSGIYSNVLTGFRWPRSSYCWIAPRNSLLCIAVTAWTLQSMPQAGDQTAPHPTLQAAQLCLGNDLALPTSPTGLPPSSFPSHSGPLPRQAAQACFQFLEHSFPPGGPLPKSSHCLDVLLFWAPKPWLVLLDQLNHTSGG